MNNHNHNIRQNNRIISANRSAVLTSSSSSHPQTFLSTRQGSWVLGRMSGGGLPLDMVAISRFANTLKNLLPKALVNWASERVLNQRYDHRLYGLMPGKR